MQAAADPGVAQVTDEPAADAVLELLPATSSTAGAPQTAKKLSDVTASCELAGFFAASGNNHLAGTRFFQNMHKLGAQRVQCGDGSASEMEAGDSSMEDGSKKRQTTAVMKKRAAHATAPQHQTPLARRPTQTRRARRVALAGTTRARIWTQLIPRKQLAAALAPSTRPSPRLSSCCKPLRCAHRELCMTHPRESLLLLAAACESECTLTCTSTSDLLHDGAQAVSVRSQIALLRAATRQGAVRREPRCLTLKRSRAGEALRGARAPSGARA